MAIIMLEFHRYRPRTARWLGAGLLVGALSIGCETSGWTRKLERAFSSRPHSTSAEEEHYRNKYVGNHDRQALYWLLRHRIDAGMPYGDVCRVLGEEGVRETRDNWIKTNGGNYQLGDDAYAFGPDSDGQTLYLVFRDDKLVNFDPTEFDSTYSKSNDKK